MQGARALLQKGDLGTLIGVDVFAGAAAGESDLPAGGHWKASLPGGILYDLAPHPVYLLAGFIGAVHDLYVVRRSDRDGRIEELRAVADGEHATGTLTISLATRPPMNRVTLYGSEMTVEANLNNMTLIRRRTRQAPKLIGKVLPNLDEAAQLVRATISNTVEFVRGRQRFYPGMGAHFRELYHALATGQPAPVSAEDGQAVVALLQRLWEDGDSSMEPGLARAARA